MAKHELTIEVNTGRDAIDTLMALSELRMTSFEKGAKADFRKMARERWDLYGELLDLPDPSLGLTEGEARVLAAATDELLRNACKILDDPGDPEGNWNYAAPGFIAASNLGLAAVELAIKFDDAAATGMIAVSHLVFPDITPSLDLEAVRKTRPQQFQQGRNTRGGIYEIEIGNIHSALSDVNLEHQSIEAEDKIGGDGFQRRAVRFRFQRKP